METQVRTPQAVFMHPQRLLVPLFQRPYVWNEENQWAPLWDDVARVANRLLREPTGVHQPHFLGAVVLQQVFSQVGTMQERTVIDGQQRLTTLQLLLDALHAELDQLGATQQALRIETLIHNAAPFCESDEDRFKVWPTNRDRPAFNCVMGADLPVAYNDLEFAGARLVEAHRFFATRAREWLLADGADAVVNRASAIERTVRELLQVVVIDLTADENAQEIFETLNARGSQLTAADLIKNFIFQRLTESGIDVEAAYEQHWREFESGFWETEVSLGKVKYSRSSLFLNHFLISRTGEEVLAREVFSRFKQFADHESGVGMTDLLRQLHDASVVYRSFVEASSRSGTGAVPRLNLFAYRTVALESEVIKPLVLCLFDPEASTIPEDQVAKALVAVESWMVRRMLVRATTRSMTQVVVELIRAVRAGKRSDAGDVVVGFLQRQQAVGWYWPDDDEVRQALATLPVYRRLRQGRLRMVLEAIEDSLRGWTEHSSGMGGERVARGHYAIEHILPVKWQTHWPLPPGSDETSREARLHTIGNLTLLTSKLNGSVSNGPWVSESGDGKRAALERHDVLLLNRNLLADTGDSWTEASIERRTGSLVDIVLGIWPVPEGHRSGFANEPEKPRARIGVADLISGGLIEPGATIYPKHSKFADRPATVLADGTIDLAGTVFATLSAAAVSLTGSSVNGWKFFTTEPGGNRTLHDVWRAYGEQLDQDADEPD